MTPGTVLTMKPRTIPVGAFRYPRVLGGLGLTMPTWNRDQAEFELKQSEADRDDKRLMQQLSWAREDYQASRDESRDARAQATRQQADQLASQRWTEAQNRAIDSAMAAADQAAYVDRGILKSGQSNLKWVLGATGLGLLASYVLFAKKVGKRKSKGGD